MKTAVNRHRAHAALEGRPPESIPVEGGVRAVSARIAGSRTVAGAITRRWRREVCARRMRTAPAKSGRVDRLNAACPRARVNLRGIRMASSFSFARPAAHDWEFATDTALRESFSVCSSLQR